MNQIDEIFITGKWTVSRDIEIEEAIRLTRIAWWEIARTGCRKSEVKTVDLSKFESRCPLCHYTLKETQKTDCYTCPFEWDPFEPNSDCSKLFTQWLDYMAAKNIHKAKIIAKKISELPLKKRYQNGT